MNDELVSISHLLLDELEAVTASLDWADAVSKECEEELRDAYAVIEQAREVLSKYPI